jgi:hypothetical protein
MMLRETGQLMNRKTSGNVIGVFSIAPPALFWWMAYTQAHAGASDSLRFAAAIATFFVTPILIALAAWLSSRLWLIALATPLATFAGIVSQLH